MNEVLVKMTIARNTQGHYIEIGNVKSGLQSDCFCIGCKRQLVAKKGEINQHHFSHHTESSHECTWSKESELHVRTKLYIASRASIDVPYGLVEKAVVSIDYGPSEIEVGITGSRYIADVKSIIDDDPLYFEVFVTHKNAPEKTIFFKSNRLNALELDMSCYFKEYETISEKNIESFIKDNAKNHKWLSINPNGFIGELFYQHYRELIRIARTEHQALTTKGEQLKIKNDFQQAKNRKLSQRETDLKSQIYALENTDIVQQQILAIQEINLRETKLQNYYENMIAFKERDIKYKQQVITARYENLDNDIASRLNRGLHEVKKRLMDRKLQAEEEWSLEFDKKNQQAAEVANKELAETEEKRQSVLRQISDMSERLNSVDEKEATIAVVKSEFRLTVIEYHTASRQIQMLMKVLKPITRSCGIPWPIDDKFVEELKEAGNSRILDALLK
ncbi:MAG: hypothetical protein ACI9T7_000041 [Oleiphilaceae bacterium]|jgi:hypothetical protein